MPNRFDLVPNAGVDYTPNCFIPPIFVGACFEGPNAVRTTLESVTVLANFVGPSERLRFRFTAAPREKRRGLIILNTGGLQLSSCVL